MLEDDSMLNRVKYETFRMVLFFLDHLLDLDYEYLLISGSSRNFPFLQRFLYHFSNSSVIVASLLCMQWFNTRLVYTAYYSNNIETQYLVFIIVIECRTPTYSEKSPM